MQIALEAKRKLNIVPYEHFSALDAAGFSDGREGSENIIHWGVNGVCAVAIRN